MELYCGIDVAKNDHKICVKDRDFKTIDRFAVRNDLQGFRKLQERVPAAAVIGMEATSTYHIPLEAWLKAREYAVYVFNPRKTKNFAKVNHVMTKTDRVDAAMLAEFMAMGFHKTQKQWNNTYPELRQLARARLALVNDQIRLKARLLTRLAVVFPEYESLFGANFGRSFTELLARYTDPETFARLSTDNLAAELISCSMGLLRDRKAREIIEAAQNSVGISNNAYVKEIRVCVKHINGLEKDIHSFDRDIREAMQGIEQGITVEIPGIGIPLAATIIAEIGDIGQFKSRKALFNFTGMVPLIRESGNTKSARQMGKYGNKYLRTALWLSAISCINHNKTYREYFARKTVVDKKEKMKAVGAVARKLTYNIYRIMKSDAERMR